MGFQDNFDDNSQDTAKWAKNVLSATQDTLVTALEQNARLEVAPRASQTGVRYNGYLSVSTYNLTGGKAQVKVTQVAGGGSTDTECCLIIDSSNYYAFVVEAGTLYFKKVVSGSASSTTTAYSGSTHLYWRIRHEPSGDLIKWETSSDGSSWTERRSVARDLTITAMKAELSAGTFQSETTPGTAFFDDFALVNGGMPPQLMQSGQVICGAS